MRKVTATRHQNSENAYTYSRTTPEVFFGTAASNLRNAQQIQV